MCLVFFVLFFQFKSSRKTQIGEVIGDVTKKSHWWIYVGFLIAISVNSMSKQEKRETHSSYLMKRGKISLLS